MILDIYYGLAVVFLSLLGFDSFSIGNSTQEEEGGAQNSNS